MATQLESSLHVSDLILQASPVVQLVMLVLLLASLYSWYLIAKLHMSYKKAQAEDEHFQKIFWSGAELNTLYNNAQLNSKRTGLEDIFYQGTGEFFKLKKFQATTQQTIDGTERILRVGLSRDQGGLEQGLGALASIGSVAPYIGLFGTVWGIYHALTAIGVSGQASIDKVAGPVGEALIMTAIGLAVAVPAVLGYNWLTRRNKAVMEEVRTFGSDLHAVLLSGEISTNNPVNRDMK